MVWHSQGGGVVWHSQVGGDGGGVALTSLWWWCGTHKSVVVEVVAEEIDATMCTRSDGQRSFILVGKVITLCPTIFSPAESR